MLEDLQQPAVSEIATSSSSSSNVASVRHQYERDHAPRQAIAKAQSTTKSALPHSVPVLRLRAAASTQSTSTAWKGRSRVSDLQAHRTSGTGRQSKLLAARAITFPGFLAETQLAQALVTPD
uniref:Uncharacterized protein n=1 Tax=Mycena chlorophos TaxID=658473 RepID=A0ABQ0L4J5_MYCCL|nr:predicted protein [Mycena chlorophos]